MFEKPFTRQAKKTTLLSIREDYVVSNYFTDMDLGQHYIYGQHAVICLFCGMITYRKQQGLDNGPFPF